jgi:transcription antitermination protein NusB
VPAPTRREVRERALGLLYEAETKGVTPTVVLAEQVLAPDEFLASLVEGVESRCVEIDDLISGHAIDWTLDRMPAIDRSVLRLAVFELLAEPEVPTGAIISEAVELASSYSTEGSGRFVNGLLAKISEKVRG